MKNLQSFNEFVNESEVVNEASNWKKGESVSVMFTNGHDEYTDDLTSDIDYVMYDAAAAALGCTVDDLSQFSSEDDKDKEFDAAKNAFDKGSSTDIKLDGAGMSGPFLYANKKAGICKYEEQGFEAYIYNWKKARF
ncbi:MAG: hypothetical protein H8D92_00210 [Pelagibacteraceae bacterium]|nr:hypothetical protein [Pelagibacteraceae bacterium]